MYQNYLNEMKHLSNKLSDKQEKQLNLQQVTALIEKLDKLEYDSLLQQMLEDMIGILKKVTLGQAYISDFNRSYRKLKMYVQKEYQMRSEDQIVTESRGAGIAIGMGIGIVFMPTIGSGALILGFVIGMGLSQYSSTYTCKKLKKSGSLY